MTKNLFDYVLFFKICPLFYFIFINKLIFVIKQMSFMAKNKNHFLQIKFGLPFNIFKFNIISVFLKFS